MTSKSNSEDQRYKEHGMNTPKNFMIPVLLLLLKDWNAHGYELMHKLTEFGFQSVDKGNFYRILRQLEKDDLVHSEWDTTSSGPAKRIYSITKAGENYLGIWANTLGEYQKMLDQFFNMYSNLFSPTSFTSKREDNKNE
ncbi:poly-beta-hydroxybutyrate-responsive repressor [Oceanobacillus piezotolerans]|uniref:Poly-beta-hydroxybutyrate-responsive repressor n=1 Tax=Oceanobacillus piezotolerans TaxID=2448030 RepID=A0A498DJF2_9BACI|nr:poly-beta-hydroxybutyrate-responsive repressor [Oceanobacillus piezotolerans]RLL46592.1 poly-beta-hydroxybutyrate-responsive repressor [Oceanobacillus piezotolerans]